MKRFFTWLKDETIRVIPAILYFAAAFNLIHFAIDLSLKEQLIPYFSYTAMTIGALIVGKIFVIVDSFPFINKFPNPPLVYNIVWKFSLYAIFIFLFSLFDIVMRLYLHHNSWNFIGFKLSLELQSNIFWSMQLWVMLLLFNFVVYSEFIRALGKEKVLKMLLG